METIQIFDLRLQTFVDIGKNQYFQTLEHANIPSYAHLYVVCKLLPGFAHAWLQVERHFALLLELRTRGIPRTFQPGSRFQNKNSASIT